MANESEAKLKTLALIIKFGHDLFDGKDVESIAAAAVSNSHALLKFRSSALFRLEKNRKCNVLGQFAQTQVNEFSAAVQRLDGAAVVMLFQVLDLNDDVVADEIRISACCHGSFSFRCKRSAWKWGSRDRSRWQWPPAGARPE